MGPSQGILGRFVHTAALQEGRRRAADGIVCGIRDVPLTISNGGMISVIRRPARSAVTWNLHLRRIHAKIKLWLAHKLAAMSFASHRFAVIDARMIPCVMGLLSARSTLRHLSIEAKAFRGKGP